MTDVQKERVPAVEGWFTLDGDEPHLLGGRCTRCGTVVFPPRVIACPNPTCAGGELAQTRLGRTGRIWSYATNHYPPPEPYVAPEPFEPYTVAAVELAQERIVVLGMVEEGVDAATLAVGQEMELVIAPLHADADHEYVTWRWRPQQGIAP